MLAAVITARQCPVRVDVNCEIEGSGCASSKRVELQHKVDPPGMAQPTAIATISKAVENPRSHVKLGKGN